MNKKSLSDCKCHCTAHSKLTNTSKKTKNGDFIDYENSDSFSSKGPIAYGEEQDSDDL